MKTHRLIPFAVLLLPTLSPAQENLVPNPGFEELLNIPCGCQQFGDMEKNVKYWRQGAMSTADILSTEADSNCYSHPTSTAGFHHGVEQPHDGKVMAMIMTSANSDSWREYVGTTLTQPLVKGVRYYVEAYVSLADGSGLASNNIGFLFDTGSYVVSTGTMIYGNPQVNQNALLPNTTGWTKIGGFFTADANYTTFKIGNFFRHDQTLFANNGKTNPKITKLYDLCAYYIDDIVVRPATDLSVAGDTLVYAGATATLNASGGSDLTWVDTRHPKQVVGTGVQLKIPVTIRTTFRVTSSDGDYREITVNVKKQQLVYISELEGRKVRKGRTINVTHEEITVYVHDKNEVDGDSISLYYGDSLIVEHVALTKKKKAFTIKVDKEQPKQLILYAENLGSVPPNTAALTIKDGKQSIDITLGSDFKFCDSVMLVYKEEH